VPYNRVHVKVGVPKTFTTVYYEEAGVGNSPSLRSNVNTRFHVDVARKTADNCSKLAKSNHPYLTDWFLA